MDPTVTELKHVKGDSKMEDVSLTICSKSTPDDIRTHNIRKYQEVLPFYRK